jgi:hypothetical protein
MSIKRTIITTMVALALVAVVVPVVSVKADTLSDLMTQIAALTSQLNALKGGTTTAAPTTGACAGVTFTRNLTVGSTGSDVKCLQTILNESATTQVATTGAGSPGMETTTFGPRTLVAVKKYQAANGFTPANQVGPMTRAKLNASLSTTTGTTGTTGTVTSTGSVSAMVASDNPASSAIVGGQAQATLLNVNFTGNGTVTSVTLNRSGISDSSLFTAVYLYDGNTRITGGYSFNTNSTLTMNGLNIVVNGSHEISVRGDVWQPANNVSVTNTESSAAVSMTGFVANGTTASSNVMGNTMSVVSGTLAQVSITNNPATASPQGTTINAGSVNQTLWSQNLSVTPRAVSLYAFTVKMIGSAPTNALANVGLYIDGSLAKTATINSNNQFVFDLSSSPATLSTGGHLVEVRGDVVAGSSRSFYLSLEQGSDISVKDSQLGVFVTTTYSSNAVYNVNGGQMLINGANGGNIVISQDPSFASTTTLVGGATNVPMASFQFTTYGEDEKITELYFQPKIAGGNISTLTNVGLYVNGAQIGSNQTATDDTANTGTTPDTNSLKFQNLGSQLIVPAGTTVTVQIRGDVIGTGGVTATGGSAQFNLFAGVNNAQGVSSSQLTSTNAQSGQYLTVGTSNVVFAATSGFATTYAAPNSTTPVHIGSFTLQTGSAEGVTVNNINVDLTNSSSNNTTVPNYISSLMVKANGTQVGTTIGSPTAGTNNFSANNLSVPVSSTEVFDVYANILSAAQNATITPSMQITFQGLTSRVIGYAGNTVAATSSGAGLYLGPTTTVKTPAIITTGVTFVPGSSLTAQYVSGNSSTTLPIATYNVVTNNGVAGAVIQDITFSTAAANTITSVTVNGKTASVVGTTATVYAVGITVPSDNSGVNIPVTVTLACVGTSCAGQSNSTAQLTITHMTYNNGSTISPVTAVADGSGSAVLSAQSAGLVLVGSVPTVTLTSGSVTGLGAGDVTIGSFTVAASTSGDIKLVAVPITTTTGGGVTSLTNITLEDASGTQIYNTTTATSGTSQVITFNTPRTIGHGASETYYVHGTVAATGTSGFGSGGSSYVTVSLGAKASFLWDDVVGGTVHGNNLPGTYIYGYPTASQSKTN